MKHAAWIDLEPRASSDYAIGAILDGLDEIATTMERTWGVGRLRRLVGDDLRAKFDAQKDKLDAAIAYLLRPVLQGRGVMIGISSYTAHLPYRMHAV